MSAFFERPLYPYLYGASFLAYKTARYFPSFSLLTALAFLVCFCLICYAITALLRRISRGAFNGVGVVVLFASVFHIATIAQFLGYDYSEVPARFYFVFYPTIIVMVVLLLWLGGKIKTKIAMTFNKVANVFLVVITMVFLANGVLYAERTYERRQQKAVIAQKIPVTKQKDIIWFLLDEYPSASSLKQQFGFDNPIGKRLEDKGFTVLGDMKSRFNNTLFSLNAIFNDDDSIAPANFYAGVNSLKQNSWIQELDNSGYEVVNLCFFDLGKHDMLADRSGYPQAYWQQLVSGTLINVLVNESKYSILQCDHYTEEILKRLDDSLNKPSDRHRFFWVHLPVPHEPFCRDKEGRLLTDKEFNAKDTNLVKERFVDYLQYGNKVLMTILNEHPALNQKIIVVTGDHGPRYAFLQNKELQKWPIAAVRFPGDYDTARLAQLRYISQLPGFLMQQMSH